MRDFFRSPLFRCLVCLILVCCILVNVSPIRTEALSAGAAITAIIGTTSAVAAVASIFQCLGVMPDSSDTSVFEGVVNDCVDALTASGVLVNGMLSVLQLSDGVVVKNHVNQGIIEAIHDWLFESDIVSETRVLDGISPYATSINFDWNGKSYSVSSSTEFAYSHYVLRYMNKNTYVTSEGILCYTGSNRAKINRTAAYSGQTPYVYATDDYSPGYYFGFPVGTSTSSSIGFQDVIGAPDGLVTISNSDTIFASTEDAFGWLCEQILAASASTAIAVSPGLVAGQIGTDIETDYKTWVDDGVIAVDFGIGYVDDPNTHEDDDNEDDEETGGEIATIPPDEIVDPNNPVQPTTQPSPWWQDNRWLNIGGGIVGWELGQLIRQLLTQNQTQTQTAVGDPQYMVDTSLFGNGGNGNNTIAPPDTGDPDPSTPTDPSVPNVPSDIAAWTFDLKDFFPFCIPFDLYDFFSVLDATPEAPQFHWELQDLSGRVYPIDIDLSAWDDLASFFRKLQLFLFITGLAAASRKFIKW